MDIIVQIGGLENCTYKGRELYEGIVLNFIQEKERFVLICCVLIIPNILLKCGIVTSVVKVIIREIEVSVIASFIVIAINESSCSFFLDPVDINLPR